MKITEDNLSKLGFTYKDWGSISPYEMWEKNGIQLWNFNNEYWLVNALDQADIHVEFKTIGELSLFFKACKRQMLREKP